MADLDRSALAAPRGVALVGASREPGSVGAAILANLLAQPLRPPVFAINPHPIEADGATWCARIADIPGPCDLAIVALPARLVPTAIGELAAIGVRIAVVISAGLRADNGLRAAMLEAAGPRLRIIGPNCLGVLLPQAGVNGSFAPTPARPGHLAFLSQSGALTTAMLDWAAARGIGFSAAISVGDMADVDFGELIALYAADEATRAILLYVEGIGDAPGFLAAAGAASRVKPVIAIKAGRSEAAGRAALSHTGALAGAYDVYRAAFSRAGIVLVDTLDELFDAAAAVEAVPPFAGDRLAIVTNGGGAGILAVDALDDIGGRLAHLSDASVAALDARLPTGWSRANPIDIVGDAHADRYRAALDTVIDEEVVDAVLAINCPTALASGREAAEAVAAAVGAARTRGNRMPVFACWLGDDNAAAARGIFADADIPFYETPADAVRGFSHVVRAGAARARTEPAPSPAPDEAALGEARALLAEVRAAGRTLLSEVEAKRLLALFGVPVAPTRLAASPAEVADACAEIDAPYVVKVVSPDMTHKSDVGGVVLGLADATTAAAAAEAMAARLARAFPEARLEGFAVQTMIRRKRAHELFAGIATDPTFGTLIMFGAGGTAIEVLDDKAIGLPPIDPRLARAMIAETRIARLLAGYRDRPAADLESLAAVIVRLSRMAEALPEIAELDVNPLLADAKGAIALDARVVVTADRSPRSRIALLG